MTTSAKVICDSISETGHRVTTIEVNLHRFVLAELNTHRMFSRNSASSRAIPVKRQLASVTEMPAWPVEWACEQAGMQGGTELEAEDLEYAQGLFQDARDDMVLLVNRYLEMVVDRYPRWPDEAEKDWRERLKNHTLHKSLLNRLIEPFMWHRAIITATAWDNFFNQRASKFSPLAQPEFRLAADLMYEAIQASTPSELPLGEYHLPYTGPEDWADLALGESLIPASVARCARVSTLHHDPEFFGKRNLQKDFELYKKLIEARPMHASPLEHVCRPLRVTREQQRGNLIGFTQLRHEIEDMMGLDSSK